MPVDSLHWAQRLKNYYVVVRVHRRNQAMRRKYYRKIEREKLRLAEMDINQDLINAVCRYLATMNVVSGRKVDELVRSPCKQLTIHFISRY